MSMADNTPRGDATLRGFARQIARLQRDLRTLETSAQGAYRSVEEGSVDFYDEDGILRERVGRQKDGSYGRVTLEGPVPPTPSEPDVVVIDNGVVAITWDGRTDEKWPIAEFNNVRVHLGDTPTFTPTRGNQVGAIFSARGGTIVAVTESDDDNPVYVRLVAVSKAGHTSTPSDAVLVDELDEEDYGDEDDEVQWEADDFYVLTSGDITAGTVTFPLSQDPEVESIVAWWRTTPQEPTQYTVNYDDQTITWPLTGFEKAGDRLWVHYAYRGGLPRFTVPFGASGWSYKIIGRTDATDYSALALDDSAWLVGSAAFGSDNQGNDDYDPWGGYKTVWPLNGRIWLRRHFGQVTSATVSIRVDNDADIYWNGTLVASHTLVLGEDYNTPFTVDIPSNLMETTNVLAVRATDDAATSPDAALIDVKVTGWGVLA